MGVVVVVVVIVSIYLVFIYVCSRPWRARTIFVLPSKNKKSLRDF